VLSWGAGMLPATSHRQLLVRERDDGEDRATKVMTPAHRQAARHRDGDGVGYLMMSTTKRVGQHGAETLNAHRAAAWHAQTPRSADRIDAPRVARRVHGSRASRIGLPHARDHSTVRSDILRYILEENLQRQ